MAGDGQDHIDHEAPTGDADGSPLQPPVQAGMPKRIGHYAIKSFIGSGGMAQVYLAVQEHPRRKVALKLMKSGITSRSALRVRVADPWSAAAPQYCAGLRGGDAR